MSCQIQAIRNEQKNDHEIYFSKNMTRNCQLSQGNSKAKNRSKSTCDPISVYFQKNLTNQAGQFLHLKTVSNCFKKQNIKNQNKSTQQQPKKSKCVYSQNRNLSVYKTKIQSTSIKQQKSCKENYTQICPSLNNLNSFQICNGQYQRNIDKCMPIFKQNQLCIAKRQNKNSYSNQHKAMKTQTSFHRSDYSKKQDENQMQNKNWRPLSHYSLRQLLKLKKQEAASQKIKIKQNPFYKIQKNRKNYSNYQNQHKESGNVIMINELSIQSKNTLNYTFSNNKVVKTQQINIKDQKQQINQSNRYQNYLFNEKSKQKHVYTELKLNETDKKIQEEDQYLISSTSKSLKNISKKQKSVQKQKNGFISIMNILDNVTEKNLGNPHLVRRTSKPQKPVAWINYALKNFRKKNLKSDRELQKKQTQVLNMQQQKQIKVEDYDTYNEQSLKKQASLLSAQRSIGQQYPKNRHKSQTKIYEEMKKYFEQKYVTNTDTNRTQQDKKPGKNIIAKRTISKSQKQTINKEIKNDYTGYHIENQEDHHSDFINHFEEQYISKQSIRTQQEDFEKTQKKKKRSQSKRSRNSRNYNKSDRSWYKAEIQPQVN